MKERKTERGKERREKERRRVIPEIVTDCHFGKEGGRALKENRRNDRLGWARAKR